MVKAAVALKDGTAMAEAILRRFNSYNVAQSDLQGSCRGWQGREDHLPLRLSEFPRTQYEVNDGLQVVENWNSTNEFICYGRHGEMATNRREQQEATTLSLQLLQNCLMLINTILIQRTIDRQGLWARLQPEDFRALTPLFYGHINPYGLFELDLEGPSFLEAA